MVCSYIAHIQCSVRLKHITPGHWTYTAHSCTISARSLEHAALAAISAHIVISVLPGTHLHLNQVKHVRVKCFAQEHNIEIMSQY